MRVLAGDIGGTKVLLQVAEFAHASAAPRRLFERRFESAAYASLDAVLDDFLRAAGATSDGIAAACFGIAGPVVNGPAGESAKVTNLPWVIESTALAPRLRIARVRLINDFQALGYGIEALDRDDLVVLQAGEHRPRAPRVVIGAGTGLGQGILVWCDGYYDAIPTEGGHVDYAPTDDVQVELLRYLSARFGRASYERVLSGPGLVNLYAFLCERCRDVARLDALLRHADPAAVISETALAHADPIAVEALALFVRVYGAQAGNLALACLATGGGYIGGGIAPKILTALKSGEFIRAFVDKGRMAPLLAAMPVEVIVNPETGLIGATLAARRLCATGTPPPG